MNRLLRALCCALLLVSQLGSAVQAAPPGIPPGPPATAAQVEAVLGQIRDPIYFKKAANLRKWHAALAKLQVGTYRPKVVFFQDSLGVGAGAGMDTANTKTTNAEPRSKIAWFGRLLTGRGIPTNRNAWFGSSSFSSPAIKIAYDPRLSGMSGWTGGNATLGGSFFATTGTTSLSFTPEGQVDTLQTFYKQRISDGTFTINADGGATLATLTGNATPDGFLKNTVTVTKGAHTFNVQRTAGGFISIGGQIAYDSTVPAVDLINGGAFGTVSGFHASTNGAWAAANALAIQAPDLVIVQLGANDLNTNVDVATYSANLLDIVTKAKATGADVVLENPANGNTGGYGSDALRQSYRQAQIALCAVQGCIVVDHAAAFGSWAQANANGLMYDAIHGLEPRYAAEAARLVQATAP